MLLWLYERTFSGSVHHSHPLRLLRWPNWRRQDGCSHYSWTIVLWKLPSRGRLHPFRSFLFCILVLPLVFRSKNSSLRLHSHARGVLNRAATIHPVRYFLWSDFKSFHFHFISNILPTTTRGWVPKTQKLSFPRWKLMASKCSIKDSLLLSLWYVRCASADMILVVPT